MIPLAKKLRIDKTIPSHDSGYLWVVTGRLCQRGLHNVLFLHLGATYMSMFML